MHDVIIAGAGPVGLFLADELGLAGCSVLVLEREEEPGSAWRTAPLGMRGLSAASVAAFRRRDLLDPLMAVAHRLDRGAAGTGVPPRPAGQFAGIMVDRAHVDDEALPFPAPDGPDMVMSSLDDVETILGARARESGVQVLRGAPVRATSQDADGVTVRAGDRDHRGRWLVGADGGHSAVRRLAGFDFVGTEPLFTGYTMVADLAGDELRPWFTLTATGAYLRVPGEDQVAVMDFDGGAFDRTRTPDREHLQSVLRRVSGTEVTVTAVHRVSTYTDRAMQATTYRRGRILLAGDAAHVHSPLGGQGLNTGLGDAGNLGWKLAATVRGDAPAGLLDTYTEERLPVGAAVLEWSRAQVALMRPDPYTRALQQVVRDLLATRGGSTPVYERMTGMWVRYDLGDPHPLVGRVVPDLTLLDGRALDEEMRDGRGLVVDRSSDPRVAAAAARHRGRVRYVADTDHDARPGALLVRPDGVVAWAADAGADGLTRALARWFG